MRLKIGELSRISGASVETIRFYEKVGILEAADRTTGNYRVYDKEQIERLRFIRHCRMQGLSLQEIQILINIINNPDTGCAAVHGIIEKHLHKIEEQLTALTYLREKLQAIKKESDCRGEAGCKIIHLLANEDDCDFCSQLRKRKDNKKAPE